MRKYLRILAIALIIGGASSCQEEYFERSTSSNISAEDLKDAIAKNGELAKGLVAGMYSSTTSVDLEDGRRHDDAFGQKAIDLSSDIISGDMCIAANAYGWFYDDEELKSATTDGSRVRIIWNFYYKLIRAANDVIIAFPSETEAPTEGAQVWAQAKTMRAYAYYNLAYLFTNGYNVGGDNSKLSVIIYTSQDDVAKPLSTAQEVWDFVKADLEQAAAVLDVQPVTRTSKTVINGSITNGLLAYTYLALGEYTKAVVCADKALTDGGFSPMTAEEVVGGFNTVNTPSWMWAVDINKENTGGLGSFWGMLDIYTYGYGGAGMAKTIDDNLFAQIEDNDIRKYQFEDYDGDNVAGWKFYDAARVTDGDKIFENDIHYMRATEMLLIKAEAKARQSQSPAAEIDALLALRRAEDGKIEGIVIPDTATGTPAYGNATLDDVYLQWRIEMWGEGQGLITMKRFKKSIIRGNNHAELKGANISYTDSRLTFPIPEDESNDNIFVD
jgi:hypothetical protein